MEGIAIPLEWSAEYTRRDDQRADLGPLGFAALVLDHPGRRLRNELGFVYQFSKHQRDWTPRPDWGGRPAADTKFQRNAVPRSHCQRARRSLPRRDLSVGWRVDAVPCILRREFRILFRLRRHTRVHEGSFLGQISKCRG